MQWYFMVFFFAAGVVLALLSIVGVARPSSVFVGVFFLLLAFVLWRALRSGGTSPLRKHHGAGANVVDPRPGAGWAWDATRRHDERYWDGEGWTERVRDGDSESTDTTVPMGIPTKTRPEP
jgi:hypothetical protein